MTIQEQTEIITNLTAIEQRVAKALAEAKAAVVTPPPTPTFQDVYIGKTEEEIRPKGRTGKFKKVELNTEYISSYDPPYYFPPNKYKADDNKQVIGLYRYVLDPLTPPTPSKGWELTGEYRVPNGNEYYVTVDYDGNYRKEYLLALVHPASKTYLDGYRWIVRKTEPPKPKRWTVLMEEEPELGSTGAYFLKDSIKSCITISGLRIISAEPVNNFSER